MAALLQGAEVHAPTDRENGAKPDPGAPGSGVGTSRRRILVVGAGPLFLSGITYYTHCLVSALAPSEDVSVLLMRRLLPRRLYPGKSRVGAELAGLRWPRGVPVCDGLDWYWGASLGRALRFLHAQAPDVLVLQWWTGAVLHSYLVLAIVARRLGIRVVLEMHETQDVGEVAAVRGAAGYVSTLFPRLLARCSALVVHSEFDRALVEQRFGRHDLPVTVIPHGPYGPGEVIDPDSSPDRPAFGARETRDPSGIAEVPESATLAEGTEVFDDTEISRSAGIAGVAEIPEVQRRPGPVRLLYFGVIRPFKGVEDLLNAFARLTPGEAAGYHLTVVGETWESWTLPGELIAVHPHADRITFTNRYVTDEETAELFADADALVLPYHRSSSSGPLSMAIGHGLPVMVTRVGGLVEAAAEYVGAVFVPPRDPAAIAAALPHLAALVGHRYAATATWDQTRSRYGELFTRLAAGAA